MSLANQPSKPDDDADRIDRALLMRISENRDLRAMESFYLRMQPRMARFLRRFTEDQGLIEETFNDVMELVWNKAGLYEGRSKVSSWVFTIAYRKCLKMVSKQKRRDAWVELFGSDTADEIDATQQPDPNPEVAVAVKKLSAKHRLVIELCYFEGYSLEEISHIIRCPLNTVKTRLHHARKKIREHLDQPIADSEQFNER